MTLKMPRKIVSLNCFVLNESFCKVVLKEEIEIVLTEHNFDMLLV